MLATVSSDERFAVTESSGDEPRVLLEAVAHGDRAAFERLLRQYHASVYRFAFRMLGDADLADEVCSDTLYTVWTDAGRFRGQSAVSSWILGIACNKSLKALRTRKRRSSRQEPLAGVETLTGETAFDDPEARLSGYNELARMSKAIRHLSGDHQAVVRLTALGHSCSEIAEIVGCPRNTVKTRMFHARLRLRKLLGLTVGSPAKEQMDHD